MTNSETGYLELRKCSINAARGANDQFTMKLLSDGTILTRQNRIGDRANVRKNIYPASEWDNVLNKKLSEGFIIVNTEKMASKLISNSETGKEIPLSDGEIQQILDFLRQFAKETMEKNFVVRAQDIKDSDIEAAAEILKNLLAGNRKMSVDMFNYQLDQLHIRVPRNIPNVRKDHVKSVGEYEAKLQKEQEIFDFMVDQVHKVRSESDKKIAGYTVLDRYNIDMRKATEEETEYVRKKMGNNGHQISRVWKVENKTTEKFFDNYCREYKLGKYCEKPFTTKTPQGEAENGIAHLFHGSGTENWFSIFTGGLWLKPELLGARICGKAFGHGIYFAPLAQKSIGYTSSMGSYWAHGDSNKGYLAIFKVATGEIYDIYGEGNGVPDNYSQLQSKHGKHADSTWAMSKNTNGSSYLMNEEVIVYTDGSTRLDETAVPEDKKFSQCTIEYLIEFNAN